MSSSALDRLKNLTNKISSYERVRKDNLARLRELFEDLAISNKVSSFENLFEFKAINLSGASLMADSLGEIKEDKYLQILAIKSEKDGATGGKNISLAYYGKAQKVNTALKDKVVEFIIRFRFEKSFLTLEHYYNMLDAFPVES